MVGLSIVLEAQKGNNKKTPQVLNKITMIKSSTSSRPPPPPPPPPPQSWRWNSPSTSFLDECFLCKQKLLPGKDIFMYKGERAFCSVECRCKHIFMDEDQESTVRRDNCSFASMKPTSSSSSSSTSSRYHRKGTRNRAGGFAY